VKDRWIGIEELADELGVPIRTVYAWRVKGTGPLGATFGKHVRFRRSDVEAWIAKRFDSRPAS
jgi:excisionase family DNA binding protein